jgi:hypothetical protein
VDDGVDDGVECEIVQRRDQSVVLGVVQEHMQEFVADERFDMAISPAVLIHE